MQYIDQDPAIGVDPDFTDRRYQQARSTHFQLYQSMLREDFDEVGRPVL